ncbi:hypothetical protein [Paenibacillus wynnii]|uniref:hypothetical protein n=1 Tax=Paenibacillus wynnii TaxID=268407 RepID=UPI0027D8F033|nr:hypothetical protein [Paenibacillus wynnii]
MKLLKKILLITNLALLSVSMLTSPANLIYAAQEVKVTSISVKGPSRLKNAIVIESGVYTDSDGAKDKIVF